MDVFLASALPLAERAARKRATKIFLHPSDLQIELMYGGSVEAVIAVFQSKSELKPEDNAFRRYLLRAMVLGAVRAYFRRGENDGIRAAADLTDAGKLLSIAGGGDTVAALAQAGVLGRFSYVSTAGGAFLEWLEGKTLPGVAALAR